MKTAIRLAAYGAVWTFCISGFVGPWHALELFAIGVLSVHVWALERVTAPLVEATLASDPSRFAAPRVTPHPPPSAARVG